MSQYNSERERPLVLTVDDDMAIRLLERASLEQVGFAVEEADNGTMALSVFKSLRPDVVLLDVIMPDLDGFTVCTEIRKLPGCNLTPIFMVTGLDDLEFINRAFEVGATDFIAKPINWRTLGHHVRYMLRASRAFSQLQKSESKNQALLDAIPDLMFRISGEGIFLEYKGTSDIKLIVPPKEFLGKRLDEVMPQDVAGKAMHYVRKALQTGDIQLFEYKLMMNNIAYHYEARLVACGADEVLAIVRDITDRKKTESDIIRLAYYDSLTGLPNRVLFRDRLGQAIARSKHYKRMLSVMFLDIDYFKRINDTLGHNIGDLLLQSVADRLINCLRKTDSISRQESEARQPTVARMGGDEFTVLITYMSNTRDLSQVKKLYPSPMSRQKIGFYLVD